MSNWVDSTAIKQSVPLAPLLRLYQVKLRRSGRDPYRGQCPTHRGEGLEAFHANLSWNVFHCFSCGAGGSILDLVLVSSANIRDRALGIHVGRIRRRKHGSGWNLLMNACLLMRLGGMMLVIRPCMSRLSATKSNWLRKE